jgi:hypothetical protein
MSPNNIGGGVRSIKLARVIFLSIVKLNFTKNVLKTMFPGGGGSKPVLPNNTGEERV